MCGLKYSCHIKFLGCSTYHDELKPYNSENCGLSAQRVVDSALSYFDTSAMLAGVQYEYNHEQNVYCTSKYNVKYLVHGTWSVVQL